MVCLQSVIQKLADEAILPHADNMMGLFLAVLQAKNASVHEEALMAISAIANRVGADFIKYMAAFKPHLLNGLRAVQEQHVSPHPFASLRCVLSLMVCCVFVVVCCLALDCGCGCGGRCVARSRNESGAVL